MKNLMIRRHKKKLYAVLALIAVTAASYKPVIGYHITSMVESYGFSNVELYVEEVGFNGITLKDVRIGDDDAPLLIPEIVITYSILQLLDAHVDNIIIKRLFLDAHLTNNQLSITGLGWGQKPSNTPATTVLPPDMFKSDSFNFNSLTIENASLRMLGYGAETTMRFDLTVTRTPKPQIEFKAPPFTGKYNGNAFAVSDIVAQLTLDEDNAVWEGSWGTKDASIKNSAADIPAFTVKGSIRAKSALIISDMSTSSGQSPVKISTQFQIRPNQSVFLLKTASMPWAGGIISVHDIALPVRENKIINAMIIVSKLSLNDILQLLTGNRASATGSLSGELPIGINNDGGIIFYPGELHADKPGTIKVDPGAIPADNAQIEMLRKVMGNFQYNNFVMKVESGVGNALEVLLTLDGKNPDAYKGRPVKLNVHLTGDLLKIIQQTVLPITDPGTLLKKEAQ